MVEQVNTLWYIPTVEHYTAKKMNERASTVWVDFRNAESSNRSQTQKKTYCVISLAKTRKQMTLSVL